MNTDNASHKHVSPLITEPLNGVRPLLMGLLSEPTLAASGDAPVKPTMDTMRKVCMPVGKRAKTIGQKSGWSVRQVATKNRAFNFKPGDLRGMNAIDIHELQAVRTAQG